MLLFCSILVAAAAFATIIASAVPAPPTPSIPGDGLGGRPSGVASVLDNVGHILDGISDSITRNRGTTNTGDVENLGAGLLTKRG